MVEKIEIKKKELRYKGRTLEELKSLETREFAKYVGSRERRTILRQFREIENFVNSTPTNTPKIKTTIIPRVTKVLSFIFVLTCILL